MIKIWLKTELKRAAIMLPAIVKRAVLLLLIFCMAAGAAAFCAVTANRQSDDLRFRIGYVAADNALTDMVVSYVQEIESVKALCNIERVTQEDGFRLLQDGEFLALAVLPDDIVGEILSGRNAPATVYVTEDDAVKNLLFRELADAAVSMLQTAQAEIYAVSYLLDEADLADNVLVQKLYDDINRFNLGLAAGRENLFKPKTISATGNDTYVIYYGSAILTIYMLFVGSFFGGFFGHSDMRRKILEKRLHISRSWQVLCGFLAGLLPMAVVMMLPFMVFLLPFVREHVSIGLSWEIPLLILMSAVFCVLYFMLIYRIWGAKRSAFLIIGIFMIVQAYMSGCIVPSALLPDLVYAVGQYLPAAFLKLAFTVILSGDLQKLYTAIWGLTLWSLVLFVANNFCAYAGVRCDGGVWKLSVLKESKPIAIPPVAWVVFKRMIFKKGILISLVLMAAVSVLIGRLEDKSNTTFLVAVFDESGVYEELFLAQDFLVHFQICQSADEVEELVLKDKAECGYILPKDLTKDVIVGRANRTITVYEDSDSVCVPLVNEVVFSILFRCASLEWYKDYLSSFHADFASTQEAFVDQIALGKTFGIELVTVGKNSMENVETGNRRTYPVLSVVTTAVVLCGVQGVLTAVEDCRKGRFCKQRRIRLAAFTIVLPMLTAVVVGGGLAIYLNIF